VRNVECPSAPPMQILSLNLDIELPHYTKYSWEKLHYTFQKNLERLLSFIQSIYGTKAKSGSNNFKANIQFSLECLKTYSKANYYKVLFGNLNDFF
jgi:hypothetical protein